MVLVVKMALRSYMAKTEESHAKTQAIIIQNMYMYNRKIYNIYTRIR